MILVADQKTERVRKTVLFFLLLLFSGVTLFQFLRGQLLHGQNGKGVGDHAHNSVDDRHRPPGSRAAAELCHQADSDGLDQHAGTNGEHATAGTHLYTTVVVFGDQSGQ